MGKKPVARRCNFPLISYPNFFTKGSGICGQTVRAAAPGKKTVVCFTYSERFLSQGSEMNPTHDFGQYAFGANDHPDRRAFITLEQAGKGLDAIGDGALFLRLRAGVDIRQAEALARQLNELVEAIEHVRFSGVSGGASS